MWSARAADARSRQAPVKPTLASIGPPCGSLAHASIARSSRFTTSPPVSIRTWPRRTVTSGSWTLHAEGGPGRISRLISSSPLGSRRRSTSRPSACTPSTRAWCDRSGRMPTSTTSVFTEIAGRRSGPLITRSCKVSLLNGLPSIAPSVAPPTKVWASWCSTWVRTSSRPQRVSVTITPAMTASTNVAVRPIASRFIQRHSRPCCMAGIRMPPRSGRTRAGDPALRRPCSRRPPGS